MRYLYLLLLFIFFSCNNQRELQLPIIKNAKVTEVLDVSPAYIFYDETEPDSTLFNRKNLISTTNWLVNVDKRLSLQQAIPHIQYLQNKRQKASMHKNENAKNYFICNDINIKNLGFLEFSEIYYSFETKDLLPDSKKEVLVTFENLDFISTSIPYESNFKFSKNNFEILFDKIDEKYHASSKIVLIFNGAMTFQDYIIIKNNLSFFEDRISKDEFIY